ncbi:MAG: hypothetical protein WCV67_00970 [Victivallaceae bacterium]|jgi:hypothetical protein
MSFFAKLKNTLTGGWAKIVIECDGGPRGDEIQVVIRAFVGAEPINIDRVYLKVRSFEEVEIPNYEFQNMTSQQLDCINIEHTHDNYVKDYTVDGPQRLDANEEYEWEYSFTIPEECQPSFNGNFARHLWEVYAGLEMPGRDPESSWQVVNIS